MIDRHPKRVNRQLIALYWEFGHQIVAKQAALGWGKAVVERLSIDLQHEFPDLKGFSPQNLWLIRQFYVEYQHVPDLQQLVGEIPWGHNILIMQHIDESGLLKQAVSEETNPKPILPG
jgi:predicted nuclease of restriction endonuclease-like (RecB) superfamily